MLPFGDPQKNKEKAINCFKDLTDYIEKLDPLKLITQLTLTYLFYPGGELKPEHDDIHKWSRWIEFISGYLLTRQYPKNAEKFIDGRSLEKLEKLLNEYFTAITLYLTSGTFDTQKPEEQQLLFHSKLYSLNVRGDTFPHKLVDLARSLYSSHPTMFKEKFGFTIDEAIDIYKSIVAECENRINDKCVLLKEKAKKVTDEQIRKNAGLEHNKHDLEISNFCKMLFGNSDVYLSFTLDELVEFSNHSRMICSDFLDRLSQKFGYRNTNYKTTFTDPLKAPWDYNTLYERPIVRFNSRYFIPNPALFPAVLLNTFHYDLITDKKYKDKYSSIRGKWLEKRTADALIPIFGSNNIILNPDLPNGDELTDVLVLYDRKIFIIQCKSKGMRYESKIGKDYDLSIKH